MRKLIALACLVVAPVLAQDAAPPAVEDRERLRAQAAELRQRAKQMRALADKTHADAEASCRGRFLMAGCLEDARHARQEAGRAIRGVDLEAIAIERRIRVIDREEKLRRRAEKDRETQEKAAERAEEIRQDEEKRRRKLEQQQAEEEQRRRKAARD